MITTSGAQSVADLETSHEVETGPENRSAWTLGGRNRHPRLTETRELITGLAGHGNAVVRIAVRVALIELDLADLTDDPAPHIERAIAVLDAALNPEDQP